MKVLYVILRKNNKIISGYPAINWYLNSDRILTITAMIAEHLRSALSQAVGASWKLTPRTGWNLIKRLDSKLTNLHEEFCHFVSQIKFESRPWSWSIFNGRQQSLNANEAKTYAKEFNNQISTLLNVRFFRFMSSDLNSPTGSSIS